MPRVFVSYSWDNDEHKTWVGDLSFQLRKAGIDVKLDQWDLQLGDSLTHFMEREIIEADRVLIVCTPTYKNKSDARIGGVGYEESIISGEILATGNQRKFIPILRKGDKDSAIPTGLKGKLFADLRSDDQQAVKHLIETILGRLAAPPPLGQAVHVGLESALPSTPNHAVLPSLGQPAPDSSFEDQILSLIVREAAETGEKYVQLSSALKGRDYTQDELEDALELLAGDGLLELDDMIGGETLTVPVRAFEHIPTAVGFDLEAIATRLARFVADHGPSTGPQAAEGLDEPPERINWAAEYIDHHGLAEVERGAGTRPFQFFEIIPTARTRKLFRNQGLKQLRTASPPVSMTSRLVAPRIQEISARAADTTWLSVFLVPADANPITVDVDAKETRLALNAIHLPEEANGVNGTNINVYHTRPYRLGLINEDLREIASGRGHYSEIRQDGLIEIAVCLEDSVKEVSEFHGNDRDPTPMGRLIRYTDLAHCVLTLVKEIGSLASRLGLSAPSVLTVVLTGTTRMKLYSQLDWGLPVLGYPVGEGVLEIQRHILDYKNLESEAEPVIKYLARCFGMFLPSVWDNEGRLVRPENTASN